MVDISKYMQAHEKRVAAGHRAALTRKAEESILKTGTKVKNPTRDDLVRALQLVEMDAVRYGRPGQIWYKPTGTGGGVLWTTSMTEGNRYLPSAVAGQFIALYRATPRTLNEAIGRKVADEPEPGRSPTAFYLTELRNFATGKYPAKFDPDAIADALIEEKIKPALAALKAKKDRPIKGEERAVSPSEPTLLDVCKDAALNEAGLVEIDKRTLARLWDAAAELIDVYKQEATRGGAGESVAALFSQADASGASIPPEERLDILEKLRPLYEGRAIDDPLRDLIIDGLDLFAQLTDEEDGIYSDAAVAILDELHVNQWKEVADGSKLVDAWKRLSAIYRGE